jgi:hypothetical protein
MSRFQVSLSRRGLPGNVQGAHALLTDRIAGNIQASTEAQGFGTIDDI